MVALNIEGIDKMLREPSVDFNFGDEWDYIISNIFNSFLLLFLK